MSQPINNNLPPGAIPGQFDLNAYLANGPAPLPTPVMLPQPQSYSQMPDGTFYDAQVQLSSSATAPASSGDPVVDMIAQQIEFDNFMFSQSMARMQQQAAANNRAQMQARNKASQQEPPKAPKSPELTSMFEGSEDGGEGGEE